MERNWPTVLLLAATGSAWMVFSFPPFPVWRFVLAWYGLSGDQEPGAHCTFKHLLGSIPSISSQYLIGRERVLYPCWKKVPSLVSLTLLLHGFFIINSHMNTMMAVTMPAIANTKQDPTCERFKIVNGSTFESIIFSKVSHFVAFPTDSLTHLLINPISTRICSCLLTSLI